jgi:hypothetical protein
VGIEDVISKSETLGDDLLASLRKLCPLHLPATGD